jgi:hypothetical protein
MIDIKNCEGNIEIDDLYLNTKEAETIYNIS